MSQSVALFTFAILLLALGAVLLGYGVGQIARRFGASPWAVGLAVVPLAAAAPVLAVTVNSTLGQRDTLTLGMILGGTVVNVAFALGTAGLLRPLAGSSRLVTASIATLLVSVLFFWFVCRDGGVSRVDAPFLLVGFVAAVAYLWWVGREEPVEAKATFAAWNVRRCPAWLAVPVAALGIAALVGGALLLVPEAAEIARNQPRGSTRWFGSIAVALVSSLAVVLVTLTAARSGHGDLAIGAATVASLCNVLLTPAVVALVAPFGVRESALMNDIPAAALVAFMLLVPYLNGLRVSRWEALTLLVAFAVYVTWQIRRDS